MRKLRLLDVCCCAGGTSEGYAQAGFEVEGVDLEPQPHYPYEFHLDDALAFLASHWHEYDAFHASPPCQLFSLATHFHGTQGKHINLIDPIRELLQATGKPYIIENVVGAPVRNAVVLCGTMFGLRVYRHRLFESNILLFQPHHPRHTVKAAGPGAIASPGQFWCVGGHMGHKHEAQRAMGIDWMQTQHEIAQAIPPSYTEYLGRQLLAAIESGVAV